jgi:integrase/recombinase XerD
MLREYYTKYRPKEYLFEGYSSQGRYSATSLSKVIKTSASKAGIKKSISAHTLRHCFATHMLEKGVNLKVIQQLMGHVSLKTTTIYLSIANIDMKKLPNLLDDEQ